MPELVANAAPCVAWTCVVNDAVVHKQTTLLTREEERDSLILPEPIRNAGTMAERGVIAGNSCTMR